MNLLLHTLNLLSDNPAPPNPSDILATVKPWVNMALGIIFGLLGLFCSVKCAIIGFHIAKAADNPEMRSEYVRSLVWPIIGLLSAVLVPTIVSVILSQISGPSFVS
ncbi:hypothetical protein P344_02240 [Spiroplasma mirum ATCC 29335]|uniref:Uncharacterized protein n=1 Tax=Spiroplasma mirum ATCC 29335 TaxID=838561 RepID=W0GQJ9_9MOLU|nr:MULTISPECIES: pilin [Spiroplasma]AHF60821.1 hypothetical protein SMM_0376 [Spiroplasma mirum ATCC 29335]AHI57796.1 hypothetical protein P344_02240 [Spiroplasma mirum ATCC 29335]AKM52932.1 hypothetical protein SATRI_v1c04260 [Spiroplasma atrichopogonis]